MENKFGSLEGHKPDDDFDPLFQSATIFAEKDYPQRDWLVNGLIPANTVTLLSGDGGTGKSLLALQLAMSVAMGHDLPWLNRKLDKGVALYVGAEDDVDEMHRRVKDITFGTLTPIHQLENLKLASLSGRDALLSHVDPKTNLLFPTQLWTDILTEIAAHQPRLVVLDTLADFFPGNENDRAQARQFIGQLRKACVEHQTTIVLLSHPSMSGMASGTGASGNTAWNNSVRSRLYMTRVKDDGYEADKSLRKLSVMKSNYGETGAEIAMRWIDWRFEAEATEDSLDRAQMDAKADRVFMTLLAQYIDSGFDLSHLPGSKYAPTIFARSKETEGITKRQLAAAMERMMLAKKVYIFEEGPASRRTKKAQNKGGLA